MLPSIAVRLRWMGGDPPFKFKGRDPEIGVLMVP